LAPLVTQPVSGVLRLGAHARVSLAVGREIFAAEDLACAAGLLGIAATECGEQP